MNNFVAFLSADKLSGWDFLVAGVIVLFVEYIIKKIFKDGEKFLWVWKLTPVLLGAIFYLVIAIIQKTAWFSGLCHGLLVGLTAMGSYDVILKTIKESGIKSLTNINSDIEQAVESDTGKGKA